MVSRLSMIWKLSRPRMRGRLTPWTCCRTILNFTIGWRRPRIRDPRPDKLMWARHWLWVGAAFCAAAIAGPPPPAPPPASQGTSQSPASGTQAPTGTDKPPDDELIEFLGADDMGDA